MSEVKIGKSEYEKIQRRLSKLDALEAGGVDSWEWYEESLRDWLADEELDECLDGLIGDLNDILAEARIDEPAGRGCGHSIEYDEFAVRSLVRQIIKNSIGDK